MSESRVPSHVRAAARAGMTAAAWLLTLVVIFGGGCTSERTTGDSGRVALKVVVRFPEAAPGVAASAQLPPVQRIAARAFLLSGETEELVAEDEDADFPENRFRLELAVAPGGPYRVIVEAFGPDAAPLFRGNSRIETVAPGVENAVEILLVDARAPSAPENLVASALGVDSVLVAWTDTADNESQYDVERRGGVADFTALTPLVGSFDGVVSFLDTGLPDRRVFEYRVRARNANGPSSYSNIDSTRTGVPAPDEFAANSVGSNGVALTWSYPSPEDPDVFRIFRREGSGPYVERPQVAGSLRAGSDTITRGVVYTYRSRAEDAGRFSAFSAEDTVLIPENPPACAITFAQDGGLEFGPVNLGEFAERSFTLANVGEGTLSGTVVFGAAAACSEFSLVGTASYALGAGESRTFVVRFTPSQESTSTCDVFPSAPCDPISASGTGVGVPVCSVEPASLDFGGVTVGSSANLTFTIRNAGTGTLAGTVAGPPASPASCAEFEVTAGAGPYALTAGQSRQVTVRFSPAFQGTRSCTLDVGSACDPLPLTGLGEAPPSCFVSATTVDFGSAEPDEIVDRTVTVENRGGGILAGTFSLDCPDAPFSIVSGGGSFALASGESRQVVLRMQGGTEGTFTCALSTGAPECSSIFVRGTIRRLPACSIEPASLDFGTVSVGQEAFRTFTITNTGGGSLTGNVLETCTDFSITQGGGAFTLTAGQSRSVTVRFAPTKAGGANCSVQTGAACGAVPATGTGEDVVACFVEPTSLDFGEVPLGQSVDRAFVVRNDGTAPLSIGLAESCPEFQLIGAPTAPLAPKAQITVTLRFSPVTLGEKACTVSANNPCSQITAVGSGVGEVACEITPASLDFGTLILGGGTTFVDRSFTIENVGSLPLGGSVSESCGQFSIPSGAGSYTLQPGETRNVTVRFTPNQVGTFTCDVQTGETCGPVPAVAVSALPGNCVVAPSALDFGIVGVGSSQSLNFTIQNTGGSPVSGNVQLGDCSSAFSIQSGGGPFTLAPGASRQVTVRFLPAAEGETACTVLLGGDCTDAVECVGVGATCEITPDFLDFGIVEVENQVQRQFTMRNFLSSPVQVNLTADCDPKFYSISPAGQFAIPANGQQVVTVTFFANGYGSFPCTIQTGSACGSIPVFAEVQNCYLFFQYESPNFGFFFPSSSPDTMDVEIFNPGPANLTGSVFKVGGSNAFSIVSGGGAYNLAPDQTRIVKVRFVPPSTSNNWSADFEFGPACGIVTFTATTGFIGEPGGSVSPGEPRKDE